MWIEITEALVITKLSGPEIAAMKTAALQPSQTNPLPEVIGQVVKEVRGHVGSCAGNTLGDGTTIPDELLGASISRIRFELATRLPVASLLTKAREDANNAALRLLERTADCKFAIVPPTAAAPSDEQAGGGPAVKLVSSTTRRATRSQLSGL